MKDWNRNSKIDPRCIPFQQIVLSWRATKNTFYARSKNDLPTRQKYAWHPPDLKRLRELSSETKSYITAKPGGYLVELWSPCFIKKEMSSKISMDTAPELSLCNMYAQISWPRWNKVRPCNVAFALGYTWYGQTFEQWVPGGSLPCNLWGQWKKARTPHRKPCPQTNGGGKKGNLIM